MLLAATPVKPASTERHIFKKFFCCIHAIDSAYLYIAIQQHKSHNRTAGSGSDISVGTMQCLKSSFDCQIFNSRNNAQADLAKLERTLGRRDATFNDIISRRRGPIDENVVLRMYRKGCDLTATKGGVRRLQQCAIREKAWSVICLLTPDTFKYDIWVNLPVQGTIDLIISFLGPTGHQASPVLANYFVAVMHVPYGPAKQALEPVSKFIKNESERCLAIKSPMLHQFRILDGKPAVGGSGPEAWMGKEVAYVIDCVRRGLKEPLKKIENVLAMTLKQSNLTIVEYCDTDGNPLQKTRSWAFYNLPADTEITLLAVPGNSEYQAKRDARKVLENLREGKQPRMLLGSY